jgi:hypothetical protein
MARPKHSVELTINTRREKYVEGTYQKPIAADASKREKVRRNLGRIAERRRMKSEICDPWEV